MYGPHVSQRQSIIVAPTLSGRPHVGTALNLTLCHHVAGLLGARLVCRLDTRDEPQRRLSDATKDMSATALNGLGRMLGIEADLTYTYDARCERYMAVVQKMTECGMARWNGPGDIEMAGAKHRFDPVLGRMREYCSNLVFDGSPYSTLVAVVDALDYHEAVHIRGADILEDAFPEEVLFNRLVDMMPERTFNALFPAVVSQDGESWCHAHHPLVADDNGVPLHKSEGPGEAYDAITFLDEWDSPQVRREALLGLIKEDIDAPIEWDDGRLTNIVRKQSVSVTCDGRRIGATDFAEMGQFCA